MLGPVRIGMLPFLAAKLEEIDNLNENDYHNQRKSLNSMSGEFINVSI